uniref:Uncharacterized LOC107702177 n=1 Tax=Sinocyclocheilus anshuiensis TaxID=1608454 RepID=A0A671PRE8_9TELE
MNLKTISEDTYTTLRKKYVFPAIEKTWAKEQNAVLSSMKSREVVLCGDGRCDSPGHCAKYCTYTFIDVESQKVADFKVISCTQVSSSNAMEIRGFKEALKSIEENGVKVSSISTDRHPQIVKEMRASNQEKHHEFDPWHVAKGVLKKMAIAAKRKECVGLGEWIPSIVNHLWWSAQTCEGNAEVLKEKWVSVIHHVTNRHDWPGNKHYHRCAHEPLDELTERTKLWLSPGSEAHKALVRTVKDKRLLKDLDHLTKCIHTTTLEVYHSMYLKYLPKRTYFGYDEMIHASMLAALDHNNNANRQQVSVLLTQLSFLASSSFFVYTVSDKKLRSMLTRYRLSGHKLMMETGRNRKTWLPPERRLCSHCDLNQMETELHFLTECSRCKKN